MEKFVLRALAYSAGIYISSILVEGFTFSGDWFILFGIGAVLAIFQLFIYPIIKILAFPLAFLSFGLFGFGVHLVILGGLSLYIPYLTIEGVTPLVLGAVMLSAVNLVSSRI